MRPVLESDVAAVVRVLYSLPERVRPRRLARLVVAAEAADAYRRETGRAHPLWGGGSLMAAASGMPRGPDPGFGDDDYCRCWCLVLEGLIRHRAGKRPGQPEAQEMQRGAVGSSSSRFSGMSSPQSRHSP